MANKLFISLVIFSFLFIASITHAQDQNICVTYISGIGCPHCAKVDPYILGSWLNQYPNLIVIDYEVFQQNQNAYLLDKYNDEYRSGTGVPVLIISENKNFIGDSPILNGAPPFFNHSATNDCPLVDGNKSFNDTKLTELPGFPKIWAKNKVLIKKTAGGNEAILKKLMTDCDISSVINNTTYNIIDPEPVEISGGSMYFQHAISFGTWVFQWNGSEVTNSSGNETCQDGNDIPYEKPHLSWSKIITLALFDSINPCELAVLILVLLSIMTSSHDKNNVLLSGLAFIAAVFLLYLFYGLVIIKFFQVVQALTSIRLLLYKALALFAILLGILNIKDFLWYKKGSWLTEMPMFLRPYVGNIIHKITSPKGAFFLGAFVTLFLLPCTMGPYIIAGGLLSPLEILSTLPYLLVYNIVFVIPMLIILMIIYFGIAKPRQAFDWKQRNVRYLHLISGSIILALGIAMLMGWV